MKPSLTDTLCTTCGLCCDGSLFDDVELAGRAEAAKLEVLGLVMDEDDPDGIVLLQPCSALRGKLCGIYAHRPGCCRTFECGLLQNVRRGEVTVERAGEHIEDALHRVARAKRLMAELGHHDEALSLKERYEETLALDAGSDPRKRAELDSVMAGVQDLIRKTFLGPATLRP